MPHALTLRVVVLTILLLAAGLGASSYARPKGPAADSRAQAHVGAAVDAAEAWFQDPFGGHGSYRGLTSSALMQEAPAVSPNVHVRVLAGGRAYCLADVEAPGHSAYYVGGRTGVLSSLGGASTSRVTLVRGAAVDAAAVCARIP